MKSFQEQANEFVQQGNTAKSQGRTKEAITAYREAIQLVPAYASLNLVVGDMLFEEGQHAEAALAYRAVVDFDPGHDQAWASLGQCQLLLDEFEAAQESFGAALQVDANNVEANYYGAMLDARSGDSKAAVDKLYRALSQRPAWTEQAQAQTLLAPLFESSRKLAGLGKEKKWWQLWK